MIKILMLAICITAALSCQKKSEAIPEGAFFSENFDNADLTERGWYDETGIRIVGDGQAGRGCIEYEWD
ncbi:MAG: hypothetical protein KAR16_14400, partial [Bacteroidales bacterium]|nr:hypothetical protein [Bacteroidales bacterium]